MKSDFHCHTNASDGALSPRDLIARAIDRQVELLAITDHDTIAGYQQLYQTSDVASTLSAANLELICGIELSCQWQKRGIHIVGLHIDPNSPVLKQAVDQQTHARQQRAIMIADKLRHYGVSNPLAGAQLQAGNAEIGRPHFARHMVASGFVANERAAFKKFLGNGKPGDIKVHWPDLQQVITWIRDSGGVAILAHPGKYSLTRTKLVALLTDFSHYGGQGIEVVSGRQTPSQTRDFSSLCQQFNLSASWGSDFHSPNQSWLDLGSYSTVPDNLPPIWQLWQ